MARPAMLATVPDEGAVELIRAALEEAGIAVEVKRLYPHPYAVSALATPFALRVAPEVLSAARGVLARLSEELSEEVVAQAAAGAEPEPLAFPVGVERSLRRLPWALALGLAVPFPVVCFYARARRLGALFLSAFLSLFVWLMVLAVEHGWQGDGLIVAGVPRQGQIVVALLLAVRLADLVTGCLVIALRRRRDQGAG
jgi:hypothetical protein